MTIRPVTDDDEHERALRRMNELEGSDPSSDAGKEFDAIATLVEKYERERWPREDDYDPIALLKQAMSPEVGHTRAELVKLVGSASRVSEMLSKRRKLSLAHIRDISEAWGIPMELLGAPYDLVPTASISGQVGKSARPGLSRSRVPETSG